MDLNTKIAVITGAASGIGLATASAFAEAGARVIVADIAVEAGERAAAQLRAAQRSAEFIRLDVTQDASINSFAKHLTDNKKTIDVLVNCAGWGKVQPFVENDEEFWSKVVDINFIGPVKLTRALLGPMIARRSGKIVNVSSDAGRVGSLGETVYAGAKAGMIGFTKSLAREMARHGVNVNCVCPGPTESPLLAAVPERHREALQRAIPMRRFATPSEVADAILFFASGRSNYITGQVLSVSGGLTMVG